MELSENLADQDQELHYDAKDGERGENDKRNYRPGGALALGAGLRPREA